MERKKTIFKIRNPCRGSFHTLHSSCLDNYNKNTIIRINTFYISQKEKGRFFSLPTNNPANDSHRNSSNEKLSPSKFSLFYNGLPVKITPLNTLPSFFYKDKLLSFVLWTCLWPL